MHKVQPGGVPRSDWEWFDGTPVSWSNWIVSWEPSNGERWARLVGSKWFGATVPYFSRYICEEVHAHVLGQNMLLGQAFIFLWFTDF